MDAAPHRWRFAYTGPAIRAGPGSVAELSDECAAHGIDGALVVTGETVGATGTVMEPVRAGLGEHLAAVSAVTTPEKRFETAVEVAERFAESGADALLGLGGGSSLDVARIAAVIAGATTPPDAIRDQLLAGAPVAVPDTTPPVLAVPTTLAGAAISQGAGIAVMDGASGEVTGTGLSDPSLMPRAVIADPALTATTPPEILRKAAMNGFNKGIESLYAANRASITDATAMRGLSVLSETLPALAAADPTPADLTPIVNGLTLVQYGISQPGGTTLSILHAFGHALSRPYPLQQGVAHAIVTPAVLEYLFANVDGRRDLLAQALGRPNDPTPAAAVVEAIRDLRTALGLAERLREVAGPTPDEFPEVAAAVLADPFMANAPPGLTATQGELIEVLETAY